MLQPAYKQWVMAGTRSPGVGRFGGHAPHSTQRLHQSTFREWSEAQEAQLAVWRPLELWDCVCKGLCVRAHCGWRESPKMCAYIHTPVSMSGRQAHVLQHTCNAHAPSGVDLWCGLWRQVEQQAVTTCSTSLSSNVMPLLFPCSGVLGIKAGH